MRSLTFKLSAIIAEYAYIHPAITELNVVSIFFSYLPKKSLGRQITHFCEQITQTT